MRAIGLLLAIAATFSWPLAAADAAQRATADRDALIALIDGLVGPDAPGVAVGVVEGGAVVFSHASGLADLSNPAPLTPQSRFNIASNAKQFTALMVLDLAAAGRIDLSEDFRTYLPGAMPGVSEPVTVEQLLSHTSGVRDIYDLWALTGVTWYERPFTNRDAMALLDRQTALNFEPGSQYLYSNSNYILLAEMIAALTGESFHDHARAFFDARGMAQTGVKRRYGVVLSDLARAYGNWDGWLEDPALANLHGDGFLFSTLDDQLHWERQVQGAEQTLSGDLITESQNALTGSRRSGYGYGLEFGFYRGLATTYHVGSTGGYNAYTLRFPEQATSIVVMGNTTEVGVVQLGRQVADLVLSGEFGANPPFPDGPDAVDPDYDRRSALGLYEFDSGTPVRIVERDGDLYREIEDREPVRLIPEGGDLYHYETNPGLRVAFASPGDEPKSFMLYAAFQAPQRAVALTPAPVGAAYRRSLDGAYLNEETGVEITLRHQSDDTFEIRSASGGGEARLLAEDYLAWNGRRLRVERSDGRGAVLLLDGGRLRSVRFARVQ